MWPRTRFVVEPYFWEQMVLDKYLKGKVKIAPGKGDV